jgi:hypothetical protein
MIYKIPCPTKTNGVRLFKEGNQISIEYQRGEPHVTMAYDSVSGKAAHTLSIRRPDIDKIIADAVREVDAQDAMPKAGINRSMDMKNDDTDNDAALGKILEFLENIVSPDDLEIVQALWGGAADVDEAREQQAVARRDDDRRSGRQAADAARRRGMSDAAEASYLRMFPNSGRLA